MFCLRSWLPLLFIPTNASPIFVLTFFLLTYYLNRPCVYCSILLGILFTSSCYWSESCWFDATTASSGITSGVSSGMIPAGLASMAGSANTTLIAGATNAVNMAINSTAVKYKYNWFEPRYISSTIPNPLPGASSEQVEQSDAGFVAEVVNNTLVVLGGAAIDGAKSGIGLGWARRLLGGAEWDVPLLGVNVRL